MSLKQTKNLYRELASFRFISNFKSIRKPGTYRCNDKRFKICEDYLNGTNKFTLSNGQVWKIRREIDCHQVNVMYYLNCKICIEKETYIGKILGDNTQGFKVSISRYISDF